MIAAISNANSTSGFEDEVVATFVLMQRTWRNTEDCMRNLYIRRKRK